MSERGDRPRPGEPVPDRPVPEPTPVSAPFWAALRGHRVRIQYSLSLGEYVFYPRSRAPRTLADDLEWVEISGMGTLYTYTVARRPTAPPWRDADVQLLAVVQWDEGPRFSTELVDVDPADIEIGMRVEPVFCDVDAEVTLLRYRPHRVAGVAGAAPTGHDETRLHRTIPNRYSLAQNTNSDPGPGERP